MKMKRCYVASLDQVRIIRNGEEAIIEYAEPGVWTTHLRLGATMSDMTDQDILDMFNEGIEAREQAASEHVSLAVEVPPGKPQIKHFHDADQWVPRSNVLRCTIDDGGPEEMPIIQIDEHEFTWEQFGRLLSTHAGWGMRILFVPEDEIHVQPRVTVREPRR